MTADRRVVLVTAPSVEEGRRIAEAIVAEKLVACVNMVDRIESIYWWKGRIERDKEVLLVAKTTAEFVDRVIGRVKEMHSYEVPEVIALPIAHGSADYLKWIDEVVGG